jgi:hypothetical protein
MQGQHPDNHGIRSRIASNSCHHDAPSVAENLPLSNSSILCLIVSQRILRACPADAMNHVDGTDVWNIICPTQLALALSETRSRVTCPFGRSALCDAGSRCPRRLMREGHVIKSRLERSRVGPTHSS